MERTYSCIHEDEVHLAECEDHLEDGVDSSKYLIAWRVPGYFKEGAQLQSIVNHCAKAKC